MRKPSQPNPRFVDTVDGAAWYATWRALVALGMEPAHAQTVADATHRIIPATCTEGR